jgi:hypothetical protein
MAIELQTKIPGPRSREIVARRGIGKRLYELRKEVVRRYNKKGIIAGGHIVGFADHKHRAALIVWQNPDYRG